MTPEPDALRCGVLVTRAASEAAATAERVAALGFVPVLAPLFRVRRFSPSVPEDVQAFLVTSGNAVSGLPLRRVPVMAVGDVTAARARAHGFADVRSAGRDAAALAALVADTLDPGAGAVLLASGRGQGAAIAADLAERGFRVVRRVFYAAVPVSGFPPAAERALADGALAAAIFLSAETAAAFVRLLPPALTASLQQVRALAIGKPAADALKPLPWREIRLAAAPTLDDVLALL